MMSRNKLIIMALLGLGMIGLLAGLRKTPPQHVVLADTYADLELAEDHDHEGSENHSGTSARISRISGTEKQGTRSTTGTARVTKVQRREDFEAQKERAIGDSRIHGTVRGREGKPVAGAEISLFENDPMTENPPLRTAVCDKDGSYTLTELNDSDRNYILVARAPEYAPHAQRVNMPRRPLRLDLRLVPGVLLSGTVRDVQTSQPVAGATVFHPASGAEVFAVLGKTVSGPAGQFSFPAAHPGKVKTLASATGYRKATVAMRAPSTEAVIPLVAGGATIKGVTLSRLTQKPVGGSKVVAESPDVLQTMLAKEDGTFIFEDMPGGEYKLFALRGGIRSDILTLKLGDADVKEDLKITVPDDLFVSGKVIRVGTNEALPGVQIWYTGLRGKQSVLSDELGKFGFETLALNEYTLEVHERNLLPVADKKSSGAVETITRKVPAGASSDEVTIRMRPTRSITGIVSVPRNQQNKDANKERNREGNRGARIWGADVTVDYKIQDHYERIHTRTDTRGIFFVNLPNNRPGDARIGAWYRGLAAVENAKIPVRKAVELELKPTYLRGKVALSDATPLSGVRVRTRNFLYPDLDPDKNFPVPGVTVYTGSGGGFNIPVGKNQKIEITFELPDDKIITKHFTTNQLIDKRVTFVYDPVGGDVINDAGRSRKENKNAEGDPKPNSRKNGNNPNRPQKTGNGPQPTPATAGT